MDNRPRSKNVSPVVTVVIPTRNRPILVLRAVESVLKQSFSDLEVVVVVDGPDIETCKVLGKIADSRIKIVALKENVGGSETRNTGVREGRGEWVAFLDDDDEWLPEKLRAQMNFIRKNNLKNAIISCQYIDRKQSGDMIRPQIFPKSEQPISEYLFCEMGYLSPRQGFLQTSTLLASRSLLLQVPFTKGLKRNQDADWLLRATPEAKDGLHIVPEVLSIFHNIEGLDRIGSRLDWKYSYDWALEHRMYFTKKSLSYFIAGYCASVAMRQKQGIMPQVRQFAYCCKYGAIDAKVLFYFFRYSIADAVVRKFLPNNILSIIKKSINK